MLTALLLLAFTVLCILLSGDRAWDNVTKPERNELVFDGRQRSYGAFVLRREYDRRFLIAFLGALGLFSSAALLPKVLGSLGIFSSTIAERPVRGGIDVVIDEIIIPPPPPPATQRQITRPATGPSTSDGSEILIVDKDSAVKSSPDTMSVPPDPGIVTSGGGGDPAPKIPDPGMGGSNGTTLGTSTNPFSAAEVKRMPAFPGGDDAMIRFVQDHIRLPEFLDEGRRKEWVEFVVDEQGNVVRVRAKGRADRAFGEAAERVVREMPRWIPAELENGDKVACWLVLPIQVETR